MYNVLSIHVVRYYSFSKFTHSDWQSALIYPFHVDPSISCEFSDPVAKVNQHPQNKSLWGFQNLSKDKWTVMSAEGAMTEVLPGKNVSLIKGIRINFGKTEGEIQV